MENYLQVLEESLRKKMDVLERIDTFSKEQEQLLKEPEVSMEAFDASIDKKGQLIDELNRLDAGFGQLYERIREQLLNNRSKYALQIKKLQDMIEAVTQKSVSIQAQEQRNKKLVEEYFARSKRELKKGRMGSKAALNYYKNANNPGYSQSQVLDQKK